MLPLRGRQRQLVPVARWWYQLRLRYEAVGVALSPHGDACAQQEVHARFAGDVRPLPDASIATRSREARVFSLFVVTRKPKHTGEARTQNEVHPEEIALLGAKRYKKALENGVT